MYVHNLVREKNNQKLRFIQSYIQSQLSPENDQSILINVELKPTALSESQLIIEIVMYGVTANLSTSYI